MRDPRLLTGLSLVQFAVAAVLVVANWGHRWTPAWLLFFVAVLGSAATRLYAGTAAGTDERRRRSIALTHLLEGTMFVAGYRAFVQLGTYPELTAGYALAGLAALVFVALAVETARGTLPAPGAGSHTS